MRNYQSDYFHWLYGHIGSLFDRNPRHSRWILAEQLHTIRYTQFVPNDDNRERDGIALRNVFADVVGGLVDFDDQPCSVLEMLIALAKRAAFTAENLSIAEGVDEWFWLMIQNIGLFEYNDSVWMEDAGAEAFVDATIARVINREYDYDGHGGLFPLKHPPCDQAATEVWYQLELYISENAIFD